MGTSPIHGPACCAESNPLTNCMHSDIQKLPYLSTFGSSFWMSLIRDLDCTEINRAGLRIATSVSGYAGIALLRWYRCPICDFQFVWPGLCIRHPFSPRAGHLPARLNYSPYRAAPIEKSHLQVTIQRPRLGGWSFCPHPVAGASNKKGTPQRRCPIISNYTICR